MGALVSDADVGWALVRRYSAKQKHDDAIRAARQIEIKEENWPRGIALGEAILNKFEQDFDARIGAPQTKENAALLKEAKDSLEKGWERIKTRSDHKNWVHVAANLVAAYRLVGDDAKADDLAIEAWKLDPEVDGLKERAALALLRRKDLEKAVELALEVAEEGDSEEALFASSIAVSAHRWDLVEEWAQKCFSGAKDDEQKARAAELLILAEYRTKDAKAALDKADGLRPKFGASITFEARASEIARRLQDKAAMETARERVAAFDPKNLNAVQRFELADAFADNGEWGKAADILSELHTIDRPSELLNRHLYALHRANRRGEARALFEALKGAALESKEVQRLSHMAVRCSGEGAN